MTRVYLDPPIAADSQRGGGQVDLSPYVHPPNKEAQWFSPSNAVNLPPLLTANPGALILSYPVPPGYQGVIKKIALVSLAGGFVDFSGEIVFRVFIDQSPVQNYENIPFQIGTLAQPDDTFIPVEGGSTIYIYVQTFTVPPPSGQAAARIEGYQWPSTRQQSFLTAGLQ